MIGISSLRSKMRYRPRLTEKQCLTMSKSLLHSFHCISPSVIVDSPPAYWLNKLQHQTVTKDWVIPCGQHLRMCQSAVYASQFSGHPFRRTDCPPTNGSYVLWPTSEKVHFGPIGFACSLPKCWNKLLLEHNHTSSLARRPFATSCRNAR